MKDINFFELFFYIWGFLILFGLMSLLSFAIFLEAKHLINKFKIYKHKKSLILHAKK